MSLHKMLRAAAGYQAPAPANTDPQFNYVSMLLHGDGTNGAQNNTFIDSSTNNFTITRNGNTTQGSLSPYGDLWSNYFDSNTTYLSFPSNTASNFGSSNFTFECWYYPMHTTGDANLFWWNGDPSGNNGWAGLRLQFNTWNGRTVTLLCSESASTWNVNVTTGTVYSPNTWFHVAVVRNGATVTAYLNGTSIASGNLSSASASLYGGTENLINNMVYPASTRSSGGRGNISNVRLVKGTALYTSNFTPPSAPLTAITNTALLTCQSNRFIDNSANNFTITRNGDVRVTKEAPFLPTAAYSTSTIGGSGYFDGTGDYLTFPAGAATAFGTNDFTIEAWVYPTTSGTFRYLFDNRNSGQTTNWAFYLTSGNQIEWYTGSTFTTGSGGTIASNTWNHVAYTRSGTTGRLFLNGVQVGSGTDSTNYSVSSTISYIASRYSAAEQFSGYFSNLRVVNGTAVYTTAFTPPSAPVTAISGTSLLLNFTNAGIFDNAAENDMETVGNAQISTSVKKYGTGSLAFDGTGDWLLVPDEVNLRMGTNKFTVEAWVYLSATGSARGLVGKGTSTTGWLLSTNSSDQVVFTYGSTTLTSSSALSASTWTHVAVVREGTGTNQTKIYIGGSLVATGTVATDFNQTNPMYIGADRTGGNALNGYIDDLRITKGFARYTSAFTPPTAAFPDQ